jgi:hypothetical protein
MTTGMRYVGEALLAPVYGDPTVERAHQHAVRSARVSPLPGRHHRSATTAPRQALLTVHGLPRTKHSGAD